MEPAKPGDERPECGFEKAIKGIKERSVLQNFVSSGKLTEMNCLPLLQNRCSVIYPNFRKAFLVVAPVRTVG
jgi:hypothetical protein